MIGIDGKNDTALTDNEGVNWGPYWHPTQPYIIWSGADHSDPNARPNYDLWLMKYEVAGGKFRKLERVGGSPTTPAATCCPCFRPTARS